MSTLKSSHSGRSMMCNNCIPRESKSDVFIILIRKIRKLKLWCSWLGKREPYEVCRNQDCNCIAYQKFQIFIINVTFSVLIVSDSSSISQWSYLYLETKYHFTTKLWFGFRGVGEVREVLTVKRGTGMCSPLDPLFTLSQQFRKTTISACFSSLRPLFNKNYKFYHICCSRA